jgi:hypothetical protein
MSNHTNDELRVHTLDEAAAILRCEASWLEEQAREGKFPYLRLSGSFLFSSAHLAAIIAMRETPGTAPPATVRHLPAVAWTTPEAATLLRCTRSWLEEKARRKEIPYTRLSGSYHFTGEDLAEIIGIFKERPRSPGTPGPRVSRPRGAAQPELQDRGDHLEPRPPRNPRGRAVYGNAPGRTDTPSADGSD